MVLVQCTFRQWDLYTPEVSMLISFVVTEICSTHNLSMKKQRAITLKLGSGELWFLCSTLPLIKVYLPIKFHANTFCSHWDMFHTKFKYEKTKGNNSKIRRWRVMVLVQCTSPQWDLYTPEVSCFNKFVTYGQYEQICDAWTVWKITKGNNSKIRKWWVMVLVQCTSPQWDLYTPDVLCINL